MINSDFNYISELCRIERSNLNTYKLASIYFDYPEVIAWNTMTDLSGDLIDFTATIKGFTSTVYLNSGTTFRVIGFKDKTRIINIKPRKK